MAQPKWETSYQICPKCTLPRSVARISYRDYYDHNPDGTVVEGSKREYMNIICPCGFSTQEQPADASEAEK